MKFYVITGEASGDMHGAALVNEIRTLSPNSQFRAWGGDKLKRAGAEIAKHIRETNFMGFTEVLLNLRTIIGNFKYCKKDIQLYNPDVIVLIDYPGFNLRIAAWARKHGYKVIYYISPQVWAWNSKRVYSIKKNVDKMICILPFEKAFYKKYDFEVEYVGHPLIEAIANHRSDPKFLKKNGLSKNGYSLLLPGSRVQEIKKHLPVMLALSKNHPEQTFCIAAPTHIPKEIYSKVGLSDSYTNVKLIYNETYNLFDSAHSAIVSSGTATLETALFNIPQVVIYIGNPLSYLFARWLIKVPYISLVNLILNKPAIMELIQKQVNAENLGLHFSNLQKEEIRSALISDYEGLTEVLGNKNASESAAKIIIDFLQKD